MFTAADPSSASPSSHPPSLLTSLLLFFFFFSFVLTTSASFSPSFWRVPHQAVTFSSSAWADTNSSIPPRCTWIGEVKETSSSFFFFFFFLKEEEEERLFSPPGVHSFLGRSPSDAINPGRRLCQGGLNADYRSSPVRRQRRISGQNVQWMLREPDVCERRWDRERSQATVRDPHRERGQVRRQTLGIKCGDWRLFLLAILWVIIRVLLKRS